MFILEVYSGGSKYHYGPFNSRPEAIAWAKEFLSEEMGHRYQVFRLYSTTGG